MRNIERKIKIIEILAPQIYLLNEHLFKDNPNYKTDEKECNRLFYYAKQVLNSGIVLNVENVGFGGMAGSQVIVGGTIETLGKFQINYDSVLERAVEQRHKKLVKQIPSEEEQKKIIRQYAKNPEDKIYRKQFEELKESFDNANPVNIRRRLIDKLDNYCRKKYL